MSSLGFEASAGAAEGQSVHLDLLHSLLLATGDIDVGLCSELAKGVNTGVFEPVPPSGVFPPSSAEAVRRDLDLRLCDSNWSSADEAPEKVETLLKAEVESGFMEVWKGS